MWNPVSAPGAKRHSVTRRRALSTCTVAIAWEDELTRFAPLDAVMPRARACVHHAFCAFVLPPHSQRPSHTGKVRDARAGDVGVGLASSQIFRKIAQDRA